ncbi:MAG: hypothetical protein ACODAQ_09650 [Phycisphaeraceae bacterium]
MTADHGSHSARPRSRRGRWSSLGAVLLAVALAIGGGWGALHSGLAHRPATSHTDHDAPAQPQRPTDDCVTCHLVRTYAAPDLLPPVVVIGAAPLVDRIALPQVRPPAPAADLSLLVRGPPLNA